MILTMVFEPGDSPDEIEAWRSCYGWAEAMLREGIPTYIGDDGAE